MASTSQINTKYRNAIGHIEGLANIRPVALRQSKVWCLDNSVFTGKFSLEKWLIQMEKVRAYSESCLFVTIPDVVGNADETIRKFSDFRKLAIGYPVAFVSQDGIENLKSRIPWDDFDCLFVGGSNEHKLGKEGGWIIREAKKHNKWIHVGRVNSVSRMLKFWQADSWDGTGLSFNPSNVSRFYATVLQIRTMKETKGLFDDLHSNVSGSDCSCQSV